MSAIPLHLLQSLVAFGDAKNIAAAAKGLGLTQPALSKQLSALEARMPGKIFARSGRKKTLTPFGRALHAKLKARVGNMESLVAQTWAAHAAPEQAKLRIGGRRGVLDRISGRLEFPGSLYFLELSNEEAILGLESGGLDLGIVHRVPVSADLVAKPLFREEFSLVVPKRFLPKKLPFGETLSARLRALPCLGYKPDDEILAATVGDAGPLRMVRATENYASLAEMTEAGLGWAAIPRHLAEASRCWVIPVPENILARRNFSLVYRAEFRALPWFGRLAAEIRSCFSS